MTRTLIRNYPVSLSGATSQVAATNNLLNIANGGTVSFWVKPSGGGNGGAFLLMYDVAVTNYIRINQAAGDKIFVFIVQAGSGNTACITTNSLPTNTWNHVVFTYDGNGSATIYVNGVSVATGNSGKIPTATTKFEVYPSLNGGQSMADARFWNTALTATQIAQLYYNNINPSTPTLWWKLDEGTGSSATDSSGNGITGTITSPVWQPWSPMKNKVANRDMLSGLSFDGSTSKVNLTKTVPVSTGITYSAWVNPSVTQNQRILGLNNNSSIRLDTNKKVLFVLYGIVEYPSTSVVEKGKWTHVAATYDRTDVKIYINGVLDSVNAQTGAFPANGALIEVGSYGGTAQFNGKIDDCKIWTNRVLTGTEISQLYYNNSYTKTNMLVEYFLNEGVGTTALDSSGNGNNGTITAATYTLDVPQRNRLMNRDMKSSLSFAGAGYAQLPAIPTTTGLSITAWIKTQTPVPAAAMDILGRSAGSSDLFEITTSGELRYNLVTSGGTNNLLSAANVLPKNTWCHVAGTYDIATGGANLYLNGVIIATQTAGSGTFSNNANTWMLGALTTGTRNFTGNIVDVRMFDGALTAAQVLNIYQGNSTITTSPTLVAKYALDQGAGTPIDTSGNSKNATSISAATYVLDTPFYKRQLVNQNLVKNGDFEYAPPFTAVTTSNNYIDGTASGSSTNQLFGWYGLLAGGGSASFDSSFKYSGNNSLKLAATTSGQLVAGVTIFNTGTGAVTAGNYNLVIPVTAGDSYTMSCNAYKDGGTNMKLRVYSYTGAAVKTFQSSSFADVSTTTTGSWVPLTSTFTAPAGCSGLVIFVEFNMTATGQNAWFDDIILKPTTATTRLTA